MGPHGHEMHVKHLQLGPQVQAALAGSSDQDAANPGVRRSWWCLLPVQHKWLLLEPQPAHYGQKQVPQLLATYPSVHLLKGSSGPS